MNVALHTLPFVAIMADAMPQQPEFLLPNAKVSPAK